eukprot:6004083-Pleurochrysis_carterae.AAC.1
MSLTAVPLSAGVSTHPPSPGHWSSTCGLELGRTTGQPAVYPAYGVTVGGVSEPHGSDCEGPPSH